jgi:predicted dehydrogenase
MIKKLRVGVIGVGFIGNLHARIFSELPTAKLIAVADVDRERAKKVAQDYHCDFYDNFEALCAREDIEAVSICLPDEIRIEPVSKAARAGKHILLEKPIARTVEEALKIQEEIKKCAVRMMPAHILRFDPRYVIVHDQIVAGNLGELIHIRAKRQTTRAIQKKLKGRTSMMFYIGFHDVDMLQWYAGSDIEEVYAKKVSKLSEEDCVFILLSFKNKAVGSLEVSFSLPESCRRVPGIGILWCGLEAVGTKGAGYIDIFNQGIQLFTDSFYLPDTLHWPEYNGTIHGDLKEELSHFVDAINNDREFFVSIEDAIKTVKVIEAVFESIKLKQPIKII